MKDFILGVLSLFAIMAATAFWEGENQITRCYESLAVPTACKYIIYGDDKPMDMRR